MEINFEKYLIKDADEFREGYENSIKLIEKLRKIHKFQELFNYDSYDLSIPAQHNLAIFLTSLMRKLQNNSVSSWSTFKENFKFDLKNFAKNIRDNIDKETSVKSEEKKGKKILFILYSLSQTDTMFPLLKLLSDSKYCPIIIADGPVPKKILRGKNLSYINFQDYYGKESKKQVKEYKKFLNRKWRSLKVKFFYNKIDLLPHIKHSFIENLVQAAEHIEKLKALFLDQKPDAFVSGMDVSTKGKADLMVAKNLRIPSVMPQQGAAIDCAYYQKSFADKIGVWGKISKEMFIRRGNSPKKVFVTGSTKYDLIKVPKDLTEETILITTQPLSEKENRGFLDSIFSALKKFSKEKIMVKLHPGEKDALVREYLNKHQLNAEVVLKGNIFDYIKRCKVLITVCSTTAIEASLYKKPIITINLTGKHDMVPFAKYNAAIGVYRTEDVGEALNKALYDKKTKKKLQLGRKKFLESYIGKRDGKSSQRFLKLIRALIK